MSKVITFSRKFPKGHIREGQPTEFVERIWGSNAIAGTYSSQSELVKERNNYFSAGKFDVNPKHHTIRRGNRWKVGEKFSPRVWSDAAYKSKQVTIAEDIEIVKIWDIVQVINDGEISIWVTQNGNSVFGINIFKMQNQLHYSPPKSVQKYIDLGVNDGLNEDDFRNWLTAYGNFKGQILCWNKDLEY